MTLKKAICFCLFSSIDSVDGKKKVAEKPKSVSEKSRRTKSISKEHGKSIDSVPPVDDPSTSSTSPKSEAGTTKSESETKGSSRKSGATSSQVRSTRRGAKFPNQEVEPFGSSDNFVDDDADIGRSIAKASSSVSSTKASSSPPSAVPSSSSSSTVDSDDPGKKKAVKKIIPNEGETAGVPKDSTGPGEPVAQHPQKESTTLPSKSRKSIAKKVDGESINKEAESDPVTRNNENDQPTKEPLMEFKKTKSQESTDYETQPVLGTLLVAALLTLFTECSLKSRPVCSAIGACWRRIKRGGGKDATEPTKYKKNPETGRYDDISTPSESSGESPGDASPCSSGALKLLTDLKEGKTIVPAAFAGLKLAGPRNNLYYRIRLEDEVEKNLNEARLTQCPWTFEEGSMKYSEVELTFEGPIPPLQVRILSVRLSEDKRSFSSALVGMYEVALLRNNNILYRVWKRYSEFRNLYDQILSSTFEEKRSSSRRKSNVSTPDGMSASDRTKSDLSKLFPAKKLFPTRDQTLSERKIQLEAFIQRLDFVKNVKHVNAFFYFRGADKLLPEDILGWDSDFELNEDFGSIGANFEKHSKPISRTSSGRRTTRSSREIGNAGISPIGTTSPRSGVAPKNTSSPESPGAGRNSGACGSSRDSARVSATRLFKANGVSGDQGGSGRGSRSEIPRSDLNLGSSASLVSSDPRVLPDHIYTDLTKVAEKFRPWLSDKSHRVLTANLEAEQHEYTNGSSASPNGGRPSAGGGPCAKSASLIGLASTCGSKSSGAEFSKEKQDGNATVYSKKTPKGKCFKIVHEIPVPSDVVFYHFKYAESRRNWDMNLDVMICHEAFELPKMGGDIYVTEVVTAAVGPIKARKIVNCFLTRKHENSIEYIGHGLRNYDKVDTSKGEVCITGGEFFTLFREGATKNTCVIETMSLIDMQIFPAWVVDAAVPGAALAAHKALEKVAIEDYRKICKK